MTVTIGIVAYNEEGYIENTLDDIASQSYPHGLTEIILVDGKSVDRTKVIMEKFKQEHPEYTSVKVLDNPKRKQAAGWNVVIQNATMDVLIRIDSHTSIPPDFVEKNMRNIEAGEDISGGPRPCLIANENSWTRTLLHAENSMFGSSINSCRRSGERRYVKTMFHAAYRRKIFDEVGLFNENLGRTEDNELHYRMRQAGYKFYFDPEIVSYQYARSTLKSMLIQKYGNGYWIGRTLWVCPGCLSIFYFVPFAFITAILGTGVIGAIGYPILLKWLMAVYLSFAILMSAISIKDEGWNKWSFALPILFFLFHVIYGAGTVVGIVKGGIRRK